MSEFEIVDLTSAEIGQEKPDSDTVEIKTGAAVKLPLTDEEKRLKALNDYIERLKSANDYSDSYSIKLNQFEGPIDLLLHLVKAAKISIENIFISHITEQYLSYMNQLSEIDLEKASEFIDVAAILIEIKSKTILPDNENEQDDGSAKRELIQKIEEYRLYKEASGKMKGMEVVGAFFKQPESSASDTRVVLKDMNMDGLMDALKKLFLKLELKSHVAPQRKIVLDRFTVSEKAMQIKDMLKFRSRISFFELFSSDFTKSEIITTFQSILEILKGQYATVEQKEVFGEIIICATGRSEYNSEEADKAEAEKEEADKAEAQEKRRINETENEATEALNDETD